MTDKQGFVLYKDNYEFLEDLTLEEKGKLLDSIYLYQINGEIPKFKGELKVIFKMYLKTFKRDEEKYLNIVERNKKNGKKGGRPKSNESSKPIKESKPSIQKYDSSNQYFQMSIFMFNEIIKINPNHKKPNYQIWSDDFKKIIEIDKRDIEETGKLIEAIYQDDFWKSNILSPNKLRAKYDQLAIKLLKSSSFDNYLKEESILF